MRNRSTPIAIRKSMAQRGLPWRVPTFAATSVHRTRSERRQQGYQGNTHAIKRIDTCELVEQAIDHGTTVSFDISSVGTWRNRVARMTLRPFAIRQRDGISYLLGTVYDARGADDAAHRRDWSHDVTTSPRRQEALRRPRRRTTPPPPHKTLRRPFDYPYRPSDSVLKNPPGCCKNGHQRYYSSTCTLSQCSVSSHFYTGGNDMKDITISRRSLLVSAGLLALARSPDAAATLAPALLPPVPTTPSAFCGLQALRTRCRQRRLCQGHQGERP